MSCQLLYHSAFIFRVAVALLSELAAPAYGQNATIPPTHRSVDENGVDITSNGDIAPQTQGISIGSEQNPFNYYLAVIDSFYVRDLTKTGIILDSEAANLSTPDGSYASLNIILADRSETFSGSSGVYGSINGTGNTLTFVGSNQSNFYAGIYTFTSKDGTTVTFDTNISSYPFGIEFIAMPTKVTAPDGRTTIFSYRSDVDAQGNKVSRVQSIGRNDGFQLKFNYLDNAAFNIYSSTYGNWFLPTGVTLLNNAIDICTPPTSDSCAAYTQSWPSLTIAKVPIATGVATVNFTDSANQTTRHTYTSGPLYGPKLTGIRRPGASTDNMTFSYDSQGKVINVTRGGQVWGYNWTNIYTTTTVNPGYQTTTVTGQKATITTPLGATRLLEFHQVERVVRSVKDELNRTTLYGYTNPEFLEQITYPEGNKVKFTPDARTNLVETRLISKMPGTPADLVTTAGFDTTCSNLKTCNKPNWTKDAKGSQTDYTYDPTHGGVLTETLPADANGVRPQKRYSYTQLSAMAKNASGVLVAQTPIWMLTRVSECITATAINPASCVGTANEKVTSFAYAQNNLWKTSETTAMGDGSLTTILTYSYDNVGNVTSVKGPRTDVDDTRYTTYDAVRRKIFEVGADPDGGGPLPRQIVHHVYDNFGNETRTEYGTGFAPNGSDFQILKFERTTFDDERRPVKKEVAIP